MARDRRGRRERPEVERNAMSAVGVGDKGEEEFEVRT